MDPIPGTSEFLMNIWRKRPALYRGLFSERTMGAFSQDTFFSWCRDPAVARLYTKPPHSNRPRAVEIASVAEVPEIYKLCVSRQETFTVLLNDVDKVEPRLNLLQSALGIPYAWRLDDTVATLSVSGSGIGYHGGHEDGFLVQVAGKRRWRIWSHEELPLWYRRSIFMRNDSFVIEPSKLPPIIDAALEPGDAIYLPTFCPHEGLTIENSLAIAFAWKGISVFEVLASVRENLSEHDMRVTEDNPEKFFQVLPDHPVKEVALDNMVEICEDAFRSLGHDSISPAETRIFLGRLLYRSEPTMNFRDSI